MKKAKQLTIVIKLGTSSIVDEKTRKPLLTILSGIVETVVKLREQGHRVIIVSSGAIGVGLKRMNKPKKPKHLPAVQALAAIGQCRLIALWDELFSHQDQPIAQILLTRNDIADRSQYLNAVNTLHALLDMNVVPIVNENDTLAVSEIKFGDNDTLSAITAAMVHADYLFLMTDVPALYDSNPRTNPNAKAIEVVDDIDALRVDVSSKGSALGTGGMSTKIVAARLASSAGVTTVIAKSTDPGSVFSIVEYIQSLGFPRNKSLTNLASLTLEQKVTPSIDAILDPSTPSPEEENVVKPPLHTRFSPSRSPIRDRRFWLLHGLAPHGTIYIDAGAQRALDAKAGLLPVGIVDVEGHFSQHEAVRLCVVNRLNSKERAWASESGASAPGSPYHSSPYHSSSEGKSNGNGNGGEGRGRRWKGTPIEIGRALVNYSSKEISLIKGLQSGGIEKALGYADSEYVALRDNISLDVKPSRPVTPSVEHSVLDMGSV